MKKQEKIDRLINSGIVAVVRRPGDEHVLKIAEALVEGGVGALELTVDSPHAYEWIQEINEQFGDRVLVGAGTVLDAESAKRAIASGAEFVFSPNLDIETVEVTNQLGAISIPGVMTPSEIVNGHRAGADLVKIFPASSLGASYIKELQGPLGHIKVIPTGGVDLENVEAFIKNGAVAVGVGSSLINKAAIEEGRYDILTHLAEQFVEKIKHARGEAQKI